MSETPYTALLKLLSDMHWNHGHQVNQTPVDPESPLIQSLNVISAVSHHVPPFQGFGIIWILAYMKLNDWVWSVPTLLKDK